MPPWGRPSRGRNGGSSSNRRRQEWERQQREWESSGRFEELDSDSDEDEGVELDYRKGHGDSELSDSDDDFDGMNDMQLAIRDKEEILVARAMARIRRAQELGRENVKLTPAESEALERKMAKDRAKGRKPIIDTERIPSKKVSRQSLMGPTSKKKGSRSSLNQEEMYVERPHSRKTSSQQNLQQMQPPPPRRRPLPDDPNWRPRSSSSMQALPYPISPQETHVFEYPPPPPPPGYRPSSSRHVSGPAQVTYPQITPYPTNMPNHWVYPSAADQGMGRRTVSGPSNQSRRRDLDSAEDDDDDDDDADQGVQVDVIPSAIAQGYEVVSRSQAAAGASGGRASQTASLGRRRGAGAKR